MQRTFTVPQSLESKIDASLQSHFNLSLKDSKKLAESVKKLSDYFIGHPDGATPWKETWGQIAYLVYFLPLNHARVQAVVHEARREQFFAGLHQVVDFGSGFGTASLALEDDFQKFTMVEKAKTICSKFSFLDKQTQWLDQVGSLENPGDTLSIFSYSLTELSDLPAWAKKSEALMILEPSTQQDGRKLMQLRQQLLQEGFHIWAPCTHAGPCPLLSQSKTDWCHDRIHFQRPAWFEAIEQHLPMKNRTLTMSYLLARRTAPPARKDLVARTVGDGMNEKGKTRQMVCRGPEREFFAWLHKQGEPQEIPRGVLVEIPNDTPKVSNELRVQNKIQIL